MQRLLLSLIFVAAVAEPSLAQSGDSLVVRAKAVLQTGVHAGNLDSMYAARAMFERTLGDTQLTTWSHYYVALADHRIANHLLSEGTENKDRAAEHLKSAVEHLQQAAQSERQAAEAHSLLASVYGRQISLSPFRAMSLGPKAGKSSKKAAELAPDNPRVVLGAAVSDFNTPEMWGGDKERAMQGFMRATELFAQEEPTDPIQPVWGHSEAYAWLGVSYQTRGELEAARAAFEKALAIDPDFSWVSSDLLPGLEEAE